MTTLAERESAALSRRNESATLAAGGGAPTGNQSNGVVFATGSSTGRRLSDIVADQGYSPADFGAVGDGATDDSAAIVAAIAAVAARGGGRVQFDAKTYAIGSTIEIGNGSASAISTINGVSLVGTGSPFLRVGQTGTLGLTGTQFKWIGAAGGTMVRISGPATGCDLGNIALDANSLADTCLQIKSGRNGLFSNLISANYTGIGLDLTTQDAATMSGDNSQLSTVSLTFLTYQGYSLSATATGINLDGYLGDGVNPGYDTTRVYFYNTLLVVKGAGGATGIRLAFTDQCVFDGLVMSSSQPRDDTSYSVKYVRSVVNAPGGGVFPQNIELTGHVDLGQQLPIDTGAGPGGGNTIDNMTTFDSQRLPAGFDLQYLRYRAIGPGNYPTGGYWSEGGMMVLERQFRNLFYNATFQLAGYGTTITDPASGDPLLNGFVVLTDGTFVGSVSRQTFAPGETPPTFNQPYYMRIDVTSLVGATYCYIGQRVASVRTQASRRTSLSGWFKSSPAIVLAGAVQQNFGTGGSPSATVTTAGTSTMNVPTVWKPLSAVIDVPTISGKTLGSGGDDYIGAFYALPVASAPFTLDIALPQWESGAINTASEVRPPVIDRLMAGVFIPPTSSTGLPTGAVWNNAGTLTIV